MFTYHKKTSAVAVYIMLIHAVVIETAGLHFLLHNWSPIASYIVLVLNLYGVLYFLADIQFIRLTPFLLKESTLHLYSGIAKGISIPMNKIESFHMYEGPVKLSREEQKHTYVATVQDLNMEPTKPQFEIILTEPLNMNLMYGIKKKVNRVLLNVDEPVLFKEKIETALGGLDK